MIDKLDKILKYLIKKYNLKIEYEIIEHWKPTNFSVYRGGYIILSIEDLQHSRKRNKRNIKTETFLEYCVYASLHELKHAIDFEKDEKKYYKEMELYKNIPHDERPYEIAADKFAKRELEKLDNGIFRKV